MQQHNCKRLMSTQSTLSQRFLINLHGAHIFFCASDFEGANVYLNTYWYCIDVVIVVVVVTSTIKPHIMSSNGNISYVFVVWFSAFNPQFHAYICVNIGDKITRINFRRKSLVYITNELKIAREKKNLTANQILLCVLMKGENVMRAHIHMQTERINIEARALYGFDSLFLTRFIMFLGSNKACLPEKERMAMKPKLKSQKINYIRSQFCEWQKKRNKKYWPMNPDTYQIFLNHIFFSSPTNKMKCPSKCQWKKFLTHLHAYVWEKSTINHYPYLRGNLWIHLHRIHWFFLPLHHLSN